MQHFRAYYAGNYAIFFSFILSYYTWSKEKKSLFYTLMEIFSASIKNKLDF